MTVSQFETLCDSGQVSAVLETFVLEMNDADRQDFQRSQPDQYAQMVRDLAHFGFDLRALERVGA
jgi:hypothetical protein